MRNRIHRDGLEFWESSQAKRLTRRKLFARLGWGAFTLTLGGFFTSIASYILPKMSYEPSSVFTIGRPEDYQVGDMKLLEAKQLYVFRTPYGFQAVSAICTHLGCSYKPFGPPKPKFPMVHALCPCHGSVFARDGRVLGGPAPRPLPFYYIRLTPDGRLEVDKAITDLSDELSRKSGEGVAHDLYLDPQRGEMMRGPLPDGKDCIPCRG
jgi:nitrite reductase/ring-hydroxylating ferredoxin subunit